MRTIVCAQCGEEFHPTDNQRWNDDKARDELEQKFPGVALEDCAMVCEDCYRLLMSPMLLASGRG
jgi:hypothetical protein